MITAMGLGTKQAPENVNLDPQSQFWSWLYAFQEPSASNSVRWAGGYIKGFPITQTTPAGMSVQIGASALGGTDCAVFEYARRKMTVLSTDGTPQVVTIPTAPTSGSRIDSIVSYIDTTSADPETETPGTPEYVKTVVVSGTAASSPTAPTKQQIQAALPPTVENWYHWADVRVAQGATVITNSNITDKKPASPNVYSESILDLIYPVGAIAIGAKPSIGTWQRIQGRFLWASNTAHPAGATGGEETHTLTVNEMPKHMHRSSAPNNNTSTTTAGTAGAILNINNAGPRWAGTGTSVNDDLMADAKANVDNKNSGLWAGGGRAHNNMPPYLSVDMWRRTA